MHKIALITNNQKSSSALKVLLWGLVAFFVAACNPANESNTASMPVSATPADANDKPLEPIRYNEFIWPHEECETIKVVRFPSDWRQRSTPEITRV